MRAVRTAIFYTADVRDDTSGEDWLSPREAAEMLEVSVRLVQQSLSDETQRARWWGQQGDGWRFVPLSRRTRYQVRRRAVEHLINQTPDQQ